MSLPQPVVINSSPPVVQQSVAVPESSSKYPPMAGGLIAWMVLTSIFLMWVFFTIAFIVFNPVSVQQSDGGYVPPGSCADKPPDFGKCFLAGLFLTVIIALLLAVVVAIAR